MKECIPVIDLMNMTSSFFSLENFSIYFLPLTVDPYNYIPDVDLYICFFRLTGVSYHTQTNILFILVW